MKKLFLLLSFFVLFNLNSFAGSGDDITKFKVVQDCVSQFESMMQPDNKEISWRCFALMVDVKLKRLSKELANSGESALAAEALEFAEVIHGLAYENRRLHIADTLKKYADHPVGKLIEARLVGITNSEALKRLGNAVNLNCTAACPIDRLYSQKLEKLLTDLKEERVDWDSAIRIFLSIAVYFCDSELHNSLLILKDSVDLGFIVEGLEVHKDNKHLAAFFALDNWRSLIEGALGKSSKKDEL